MPALFGDTTMADPTKPDADEPRVPYNFPPNVNPSDENIQAFKDQQEADRKAQEDGKQPDMTEERIGEGIREIPLDEREPEASEDGKSQVRQRKTTDK
jgi:hypothetical protein